MKDAGLENDAGLAPFCQPLK